jgi:hypothetical protein
MWEHRRGTTIAAIGAAFLLAAAARTAAAACGGTSPMLAAASASQQDVEDCVAAARSGDTITVPAGTETWPDAIQLPADKDLDVVGATAVSCGGTPITCAATDATTITCSAAVCFTIDLGASHRVSGFTLLEAGNGGIASAGEQDLGKHFRIDHNHIVSSSGWAPMEIGGGATAVHPQGIVDNNLLVDISIHANGTVFQLDEGDQQHALWAQETPLGDSVAIIYIEDNHYENTVGNINNADANYGGRYVYRFNNTTSGRQAVEFHSVQGDNRGGQRFEVYGNSGANPDGFSGTAFLRGGSGVAFANRLTAGWPSIGIEMDNVRSEGDPGGGVGACDGTSGWDQNSPGESGYRCRDQLGSSRDLTQWDHQPPQPYAQEHQPVYLWDNLEGSAPMNVSNGGLETWLAEDRDWYQTAAAFDGTAGVGVGLIGARPQTCTTGVAYWATDEGEWNSRRDGPDGRLYRCTAPDNWSLYYTPYPYPHPWAGGVTPPPPDADADPGTPGGGNGGCCQASPTRAHHAATLVLALVTLMIAVRRPRSRR